VVSAGSAGPGLAQGRGCTIPRPSGAQETVGHRRGAGWAVCWNIHSARTVVWHRAVSRQVPWSRFLVSFFVVGRVDCCRVIQYLWSFLNFLFWLEKNKLL